jgi:hypothetical protein
MGRAIESFMQTVLRTVNRTFSDVQLNKRFYQVDPKLRGDRVQVRFDPFASWDGVKIYSLKDEYLGTGVLHNRSTAPTNTGETVPTKPRHSFIDFGSGNTKRIWMNRPALITGRSFSKDNGLFTSSPKPWPNSWAEEPV